MFPANMFTKVVSGPHAGLWIAREDLDLLFSRWEWRGHSLRVPPQEAPHVAFDQRRFDYINEIWSADLWYALGGGPPNPNGIPLEPDGDD